MKQPTDRRKYLDLGLVSMPLVLTVVFVLLRATGVVNWGWWITVSPLWISGLVALVTVGFLVSFSRSGLGWGYKSKEGKDETS